MGNDLEDAVLAATNYSVNQEQGLMNLVELSLACENLPNYDTFTRTDAQCVLYTMRG